MTHNKRNDDVKKINSIIRFFKKTLGLSICSVIFCLILIFCCLYLYYFKYLFYGKALDVIANILFQISIGYLVSYIFYIIEVYVPQKNKEIIAIPEIKKHLRNIFQNMHSMLAELCKRYEPKQTPETITNDELLQVLNKLNLTDPSSVANPNKFFLANGVNKYYSIKELLLVKIENIDEEINKIFTYYNQYLSPRLMDILEEIASSHMHTNMKIFCE